jgi:proliferating cell nuclear antigen
MSKLVKVRTEHSAEIKVLFDVMKDVVHEFKMDFIRDTNSSDSQTKSDESDKSDDEDHATKKKSKKAAQSDEESDDNDSDESEEEVETKKKKKKKKSKSNDNNDSDDESDDEKNSKKKKKKTKKEKTVDKKKAPSNGGIRILELDEHQTLLIYVKLNADKFVDFYVKYPIYSVGIDLKPLQQHLKSVNKDSLLTIYVDKDDEQNIVVQSKNESKPSTTTYTQKILDLDDRSKKLPKQSNFEILVTMETSEFHTLCREMHGFSDYIEITCTAKEISFKCRGDSNKLVKKFPHTENSDKGVKITCLTANKKKPVIVQAIYELRYLVTFGKCTNMCPDMQLYLRNDYPIFIHYTVSDLGKMLVGLTPVDETAIKKDDDYNEENDKFYESNTGSRKVTVKN